MCGGIGGRLCRRGGDTEDDYADVETTDRISNLVEGLDDEIGSGDADLGGVIVEERDDVEALVAEALVGGEGAAEVAGADDGAVPDAVGAEDAAELGDELGDAVTDAAVAELSEVGEVTPDLGVGEVEGLTEGTGGDGDAGAAHGRPQY